MVWGPLLTGLPLLVKVTLRVPDSCCCEGFITSTVATHLPMPRKVPFLILMTEAESSAP
ncbi:hypothetical protein D3C78_1769070 [compost metagenome]